MKAIIYVKIETNKVRIDLNKLGKVFMTLPKHKQYASILRMELKNVSNANNIEDLLKRKLNNSGINTIKPRILSVQNIDDILHIRALAIDHE